jgi:hypothetical protein
MGNREYLGNGLSLIPKDFQWLGYCSEEDKRVLLLFNL